VFERFTDRARRVLILAQEEARLLNHSFIGTEHILLGLLAEGEGVAAKALEQLDISLEAARQKVEDIVVLSGTAPMGSPPFTPRAKKVLELSYRESLQLGHDFIGTEHLLLGLVSEGEGVGAQVLVSLGADLARVRQKVIELLSGYQGEESVGAGPRVTGAISTGPQARLVACSFCGRQPPEAGQLISGNDAFICEHCVRQLSGQLSGQEHGVDSGVTPTGTSPDNEDEARIQIAHSFSALTTPSDDGQSVPSVERGQDLGPSLLAFRRSSLVAETSALTVSVDEVVFLDAEHAAVWFTLYVDGNPLLSHLRGTADVVEGEWKVARSTFCELMARAGVSCPWETD